MRYEDGVPADIGDLYESPAANSPNSCDNIEVLMSHIRALSAFIAQLDKRVMVLEVLADEDE